MGETNVHVHFIIKTDPPTRDVRTANKVIDQLIKEDDDRLVSYYISSINYDSSPPQPKGS